MPKAEFSLRSSYNVLSFVRWLAAFMVVIGHVRHALFADLKLVEHPSLLLKGFYFFTGFGDESVIIFFVLSGLLVGGLSMERWRRDEFKPGEYFAHRISRIYTVLLPSLVFGFLLDRIGLAVLNDGAIYTDAPRYQTTLLNFVIVDQMSLATFFGNVFGFQHVLVGTFGSNGPLWSLANEWWYYLMFAVGGFGLFGSIRRKLVASACLLVFVFLFPAKIVLWGLVWLLGVAIPYVVRRLPSLVPGLWWSSAVLLVCLCVVRLSHNQDAANVGASIFSDFSRALLLGLAFSVWVASLVIYLPETAKIASFGRRFNERMAEFSFTLYLFHFPLMVFLLAAMTVHTSMPVPEMQPSLALFVSFAVFVVILYAYSYACFWIAERHTAKIRSVLLRLFADKGVGIRTS